MKMESEVVFTATLQGDLFQAYEKALNTLGADDVYFLESLQGPEPDCRISVIGMNKIAEISLSRDRAEVNGTAPMRAFILAVIRSAVGYSLDTDDSIPIADPGEFWTVLRALLDAFPEEGENHRFGYLASLRYETGHIVESVQGRQPDEGGPLVTLGLFQSFVVEKDGVTSVHVRHVHGVDGLPTTWIRSLLEASPPQPPLARPPADVHFTMPRDHYTAAANRALEYIRAGDIYQVQIGHEVQVSSRMAPVALYRRLREENPSPFMFICRAAGVDLVGASPESYVRLEDGEIAMRPIAGTIGKSPGRPREQIIADLTESAKENAEHVMLVDLCRNDIGRVCADHSLNVPDFMIPSEFSNLFHLISTVTGKMREDRDAVDLIRATFPAGTMVGAPKIRAMQIIEELECSRRGHYAGGIGLLGFGKFANLALCIRMASRMDDKYYLRASAGVVIDSDPLGEWNETLVKMNRIHRALTGLEMTP
jgi:anthranilate synthase component 1